MPTIGALPTASTATNTDELIVQQGAGTRRMTRAQLVQGIQSALDTEIATTNTEITDLQNSRLRVDGTNSMTGLLTLVALDPTGDNHAVRRIYVNTADNLRLLLSGGTMTGVLTLSGAPTADLHASTRLYVDQQRNSCIRELENYNPVTTGAYPVLYNSLTINAGAAFYITTAGTIGPAVVISLQIGDLLIARVDSPGNVHADWAVINSNTVTASVTEAGIAELATDAEAVAKTATDRVLTASNLATGNFQASATFEGLVELATDLETTTGTATNRAVTPANLVANITDHQEFIGIQHIVLTSAGTWTATASAVANDVFSRKTAAAETATVTFDVGKSIRTTASRGFRLDSYDVIYKIGTAALTAHTTALTTLNFADNTAANPTSATPAITGTLITAFAANIRATNITVDTPAFLNTAAAKHMISVTLTSALTSVYDIYGINLRWVKSGL